MLLTPMVEPAAPEFAVHPRPGLPKSREFGKLPGCTSAEVDGGRQVGQRSSLKHRTPGAVGCIHLAVESGMKKLPMDGLHIHMVIPKRAVLVFDLAKNDWAA